MSRRKKLEKVDTKNPLSTFSRQTKTRKIQVVPSKFVKEKWLEMRCFDDSGKFIPKDSSKLDELITFIKSNKLVKKFSGDVFLIQN